MPVHHEVKRFGRFSAVGILNTLVDFGSVFLFTALHFNTYLAVSLGFILASTNSYFWNRHWTFSDRKSSKVVHQYLTFIGLASVGLIINNLVVFLFLHYVPITNPFVRITIIRFSAIIVVVFWNYIASRYIVFRSSENQIPTV